MRSDSILVTGMTGASVDKAERMKIIREQKRNQKLANKTKLIPAAELVTQELQKEKDRTTLSILEAVDNFKINDKEHKANMQSLHLYRQSMANLSDRLNRIMRVKDET